MRLLVQSQIQGGEVVWAGQGRSVQLGKQPHAEECVGEAGVAALTFFHA